jgi:hypothetical protein
MDLYAWRPVDRRLDDPARGRGSSDARRAGPHEHRRVAPRVRGLRADRVVERAADVGGAASATSGLKPNKPTISCQKRPSSRARRK